MKKTEKDLEYEKAMEDYSEMMKKEAEEYQKNFDKVKAEVIELMSEDWWKDLTLHLSDGNEDWNCWNEVNSPAIVDYKKGKLQEVFGDIIKEEWVNQTTDGGFTGDEFAGTIYFELKNGKYLQFAYAM